MWTSSTLDRSTAPEASDGGTPAGSAGEVVRAQLPVDAGEVGQLVVGVQAARVGHHPGGRAADPFVLQSGHRAGPVEAHPPGRDAEDGEHPRPVPRHELGQGRGTGPQLLGRELGGGQPAGGRSCA